VCSCRSTDCVAELTNSTIQRFEIKMSEKIGFGSVGHGRGLYVNTSVLEANIFFGI